MSDEQAEATHQQEHIEIFGGGKQGGKTFAMGRAETIDMVFESIEEALHKLAKDYEGAVEKFLHIIRGADTIKTCIRFNLRLHPFSEK